MPVYEEHDVICEEAGHRTCDCRCAGLCHGWPGAMAVARRSPRGDLLEWRRRTDEVRRGNPVVPPARRSHNQRMRHRLVVVDETRIELALGMSDVVAAEQARRGFEADTARADLVWQRVWSLARGLHRDVLPGLIRADRRQTGAEDSTLPRRLAEMHWWCELATWTVQQLDEDRCWLAGRWPDLAHRFRAVRRGGDNESLAPELARMAVEGVWTRIGGLPRIGEPLGLERALLALRVLGTFMCRQPERHRAVIRTCLGPLAQHLPPDTRIRLRTAFPDWSDGTRRQAAFS